MQVISLVRNRDWPALEFTGAGLQSRCKYSSGCSFHCGHGCVYVTHSVTATVEGRAWVLVVARARVTNILK